MMDKCVSFKTVEDVLDFAISEEEKAARLYSDLAIKVENPVVGQFLERFAQEERDHKAKLVAVKQNEDALTSEVPVVNHLDQSHIMTEIDTSGEMDYTDVLVLAMRKEKSAYRLYTYLADHAQSPEVAHIFSAIAAEEANHRARFEIEYEDWTARQDQ